MLIVQVLTKQVQIMAFMGWFPFLFYTTLYVRYVMSYQLGRDADEDVATRAGSFALLIHAFVAYGAGTILPYLSEREQRLLPDDEDEAYSDEDEHARVRALVQQWKADVATSGRRLRLPRSKLEGPPASLHNSAVHAPQCVDCRSAALLRSHDEHVLHRQCRAGDNHDIPRRHLLGCRVLGVS
jgi:hypothetical protein